MIPWLRRRLGVDAPSPPPNPAASITVTASVVRSTYDPDVDLHPDYPFQIVGESYYQDALREIVETSADPGPNWPYHGAQCAVMAQVIPEDHNPYDPLAVRVEIQGHKVGYLSRADARLYRKILDKNSVPLKALIVGGWDHTYRGETDKMAKGSFGVRLAFGMEER